MPTAHPDRPPPLDTNSISIIGRDVLEELRSRTPFPPGPTGLSLKRTLQMTRDPLPPLLAAYEEEGPIFAIRVLHRREIFMLGPEANHFIAVAHPEFFHWREGHFGDLTPLIGDGILTTDGEYHHRARRLMMPAFHRERIETAVEVMLEEAAAGMATWAPGDTVDVYDWARTLALRIAMRALLGLDPDDADHGALAADLFERALAFWGTDFHLRVMRGPRTPWSRMLAARRGLDEIVYEEVRRRRADGPVEGRQDIMSMLIEAEDEDGSRFADEEVRDQIVTLMFAGHDTSTSTIAFLLYELARHPDELARVVEGSDEDLEMAMDEALRLYPPVWIGCRRAVSAFEFGGRTVPEGAFVNYSPYASHRLAEVFPEPDRFVPERFTRERKAELPKGAYVPFGGGSRICIGKRFGQTVVKTVVTSLLQRFRFELPPGHRLELALEPTLSPRGGLPMVLRERA